MNKVCVSNLSELKQVLDNSDCSKTRRWAKQTLNRIDRRVTRIFLQEQVWTEQYEYTTKSSRDFDWYRTGG